MTRRRCAVTGRGRIPTGLLGGSFNPAHGGHRAISLAARDRLDLAEIWWLVSPGNPLKPGDDMGPLTARLASARRIARRARIRPTAIEAMLNTRYTIDTLRRLVRRYPARQFIWIMGGDNLATFDQWRRWHDIARLMPIAVVARPGYKARVSAAPAMSWLGRFVQPSCQSRHWTTWSPPALVLLRFRPDPRSATALRRADPIWDQRLSFPPAFDPVSHRQIAGQTAPAFHEEPS